ncbi:Uroporphyrinogen-III synthase [Clonorchis sinensis]|uniref:Uroporphyrinogen-III synthase n=1 Tax=Clonorchis sinensis TaxID=79923 RepID=A0A3R7GSH6_CLOSI|nr:Uroporphyrinogen-III synthase [Clonorchis sinensis]
MHILLLKALNEQASGPHDDPYVQVLVKAGFTADLAETLDFTYHTAELARCQSWRDNHSAIVFTSPRAVTAYTKAGLKGQQSDLCFVVGPSTDVQAKKAGFSPKGAQAGDAETLSKVIVDNYANQLTKPVFFPASQIHRADLPQYLEKNGIKVDILIAYSSHENVALKDKVRLNLCEGNPIPDCIVFFSPSGVTLTESILKTELKPHRPKVKLVAMGRATASKLQEYDMNVAGVAASPRPESLLQVIQRLAGQL